MKLISTLYKKVFYCTISLVHNVQIYCIAVDTESEKNLKTNYKHKAKVLFKRLLLFLF